MGCQACISNDGENEQIADIYGNRISPKKTIRDAKNGFTSNSEI